MANPKRKNRGRKVLATVLIIIAVLIGVGAIAVKFLREKVTSAYGTKNSDEIKTASVTVGSISTTISGSGVLTEQETTSVTLPSGVAAQSILVKENDTVEAGQKIANVRMASVLTAINAAQETLDDLDSQISEASKDTVDTYVRSSVKGRVKKIYCKAGDSVLSVMYEHNALMILSLDGYLAFEIDAGTLKAGSSVNVKLAKGGTYKGKVESISGEKAVVLITDDKPLVGDTATASDSKGNVLGSGELYIHQPLSVTGYAGTVSRVNVAENRIVYAKGILLTLKDTAFTANYESLLEQRAEVESDFNELVQLYQAGAVYAPIAGKIQTVTEEEDSENTEDTWELTVIVPQEQMIVTAAVDESDILSVSVGQEADVTVSSISEDPFTGIVTSIEKAGTSNNGVTTYTVEVTMDRTEKMLPNMSASISVRIEGVDNALIVPENAVTKTRDSAYVYTSVDNTTGELSGRIEVTIGLSGGGYTEIKSGLKEGDTVYYKETEKSDFSIFMNGFSGFGGGSGSGNRPSGGNGGNRPSGGNGGNRPSGGSGGSRPSGGNSGGYRP